MIYVRYSTHLTLRRDEFIDWYFTRSLRFRLLVFFFELKQKLFYTKFWKRGVMPSLVPTMCRTISMALYFSSIIHFCFETKIIITLLTINFDLPKGKQDSKLKTLVYIVPTRLLIIIFRIPHAMKLSSTVSSVSTTLLPFPFSIHADEI